MVGVYHGWTVVGRWVPDWFRSIMPINPGCVSHCPTSSPYPASWDPLGDLPLVNCLDPTRVGRPTGATFHENDTVNGCSEAEASSVPGRESKESRVVAGRAYLYTAGSADVGPGVRPVPVVGCTCRRWVDVRLPRGGQPYMDQIATWLFGTIYRTDPNCTEWTTARRCTTGQLPVGFNEQSNRSVAVLSGLTIVDHDPTTSSR